jgi:hypothetical protein
LLLTVLESIFFEQVQSRLSHLIERCPIASGFSASKSFTDLDAFLQYFSLLFRSKLVSAFVGITMQPDFGSGLDNLFDFILETFRRVTGDKPGAPLCNSLSFEQVKETSSAYLGGEEASRVIREHIVGVTPLYTVSSTQSCPADSMPYRSLASLTQHRSR